MRPSYDVVLHRFTVISKAIESIVKYLGYRLPVTMQVHRLRRYYTVTC
jgi:hypothetical protein